MIILSLVIFTLLDKSVGLDYEVMRTASEPDRILLKTNTSNTCTTYRAKYYERTKITVTCACPTGMSFHSIHSELPACYRSNAENLGCVCLGKNCISIIAINLLMGRTIASKTHWCNSTLVAYKIKIWTLVGWKTFSRPDDMIVEFLVQNNVGLVNFKWKVDGFSVIPSYSGNLFLITVTCNNGKFKNCFLAKSPGVRKYNMNNPTTKTITDSKTTVETTSATLQNEPTKKEDGKSSTLILIVIVIGSLLLIIILIILVMLIYRTKGFGRNTSQASSDQTQTRFQRQEIHYLPKKDAVASPQDINSPYSYVTKSLTRPRPIPAPRQAVPIVSNYVRSSQTVIREDSIQYVVPNNMAAEETTLYEVMED
ncbi:uncharacterized protein LOC130649179 [Hydractinia symbiolongicarpus]|uniref:uncharacterized protein LOC130649179 n=1 Tax=Hydractinia symbiolongicarpus TaxID=13093 RepID=UPI00254BB92B|nr:uncharacterized protein LOC130649179 [Hydractinia symbiolongicarpus]